MPVSNTYIDFTVTNYKGESSLSSYNLEITPFSCIPRMDKVNDKRVLWDFGDGTESRSFSAYKSYEFPGVYTIHMIVYDCNNNAIISTVEKTVTVYGYIDFTFSIESVGYLVTENGSYILTENDEYLYVDCPMEIKCGCITGPLTLTAHFPTYQPVSDIYYQVNGSNSKNYWDTTNNKFNHLENFYSYYDTTYNYAISSYQYTPINKVTLIPDYIYAKLENSSIVRCLSSDAGAVFIGASATKEIYFKDDTLSELVLTKFWFDKLNNKLSKNNPENITYLNNLGVTLSANIIDNQAHHLSITSNGIDGEGFPIDSFQINPIKYFDTKIPFIIKIKDVNHMSIKNFDTIPLSSLNISISSTPTISSSEYTIVSLNDTLSNQNSGGAFRGYISIPSLSSTNILENVSISAAGTFTNTQAVSYNLEGTSNMFNVYSKNYFDVYKNNENFNASQTIMDLRFQETLLDKTVLFEDFIGSVLGNADSTHESIGLKFYEKIGNFVNNTQDLDICEQEYIDSLASFLDYNNNGEEKYVYPERLKRIINIASIGRNKLFGEPNKFKENFDIRGHTSKDEYGINLGDEIDPKSYIVDASKPIVALEKFSNVYTLLNTQQPLLSTYPLSTYSSDWGWPMVLPQTFDFKDIDKYYLFFEYNPQYDNTLIGGVVDFTNSKTTVSNTAISEELFKDGGIFENMFLDTLYQSLSLIDNQ